MIQIEDIVYSSTIDSINNLAARVSYDNALENMPILLLMHGYSGDKDSFGDETLTRLANYGLFVVSVGMRERDGAGGSSDSGGREIYDIYDALIYVRSNYAITSQTRAAIAGYSGGGGNALAFASRFPDAVQDVISHFGISDYGYNETYGWYNQSASDPYKATMSSWIGGDPDEVIDRYRARNYVESIKNFSNGHLYLFHDIDDTVVPVMHSSRVASEMSKAGLSNYTTNYSNSGSTYRWSHGYPANGSSLSHTEDIWTPSVINTTHQDWSIPSSGKVRVSGWIKTKLFSIWLGTGVDDVADVSYDTSTNTYNVIPLTGAMTVTIVQGEWSETLTLEGELAMAGNIDGIIDVGLSACKTGAIRATLCSSEPTTYSGIAAVALGSVTISSADFVGPADDTSGRKITFSGKSGAEISADGTASFCAFHDNSSVLYATAPVTSQAVVAGQSWTLPSCKISVSDPA